MQQLNQASNNSHRCSQGCSISNKRKKRDVTRDEVEHEESTNKVILTQGPLVFKKEEQQSGGKLNMCLIAQGMSVGTLKLKEMFQYPDVTY